ncbi:MAG: CopG family transcriptional regulator [Deltaproteobacteria bacterium]|nr:CopG family transcriptional regulator [Deltaproteobacteria bacterium]
MRNLTLSVDEAVLLEARKIALDRNTSVNRLIREYLADLVRQDGRRRAALSRLSASMRDGLYTVGKVDWSREDLHER